MAKSSKKLEELQEYVDRFARMADARDDLNLIDMPGFKIRIEGHPQPETFKKLVAGSQGFTDLNPLDGKPHTGREIAEWFYHDQATAMNFMAVSAHLGLGALDITSGNMDAITLQANQPQHKKTRKHPRVSDGGQEPGAAR